MTFKLPICNPSPYPRRGHVTIPLPRVNEEARRAGRSELGVGPGAGPVTLLDAAGEPLPSQLDDILPGDPSSAALCFSLTEELRPGTEADYREPALCVTVAGRKSPAAGRVIDPKLALDVIKLGGETRGVKLLNSRLEVWFNFAPSLHEEGQHWYAGAATSVRLDGDELLDPNSSWEIHDWEKRCMQLYYLRLPRPAWAPNFYLDVGLVGQPYQLKSTSVGPVRVSFTVASPPFEYVYGDPLTRQERSLECRLYRVISLYAGADYVSEELCVKGVPKGGDSAGGVPLSFIASYFTYINAMRLHYSRYANVPDWFAVSSLARPFISYGFATDVHAGPVTKPHPGFPNWDKEENSFSWQLYPSQYARCLHLFMRFRPGVEGAGSENFSAYEARKADEARQHFEDRTGQRWYEEIFKPLGLRIG